MHCKTAVVAQLLTAWNEDGLGAIRLLRSPKRIRGICYRLSE
jgi:hypothetical protein